MNTCGVMRHTVCGPHTSSYFALYISRLFMVFSAQSFVDVDDGERLVYVKSGV